MTVDLCTLILAGLSRNDPQKMVSLNSLFQILGGGISRNEFHLEQAVL